MQQSNYWSNRGIEPWRNPGLFLYPNIRGKQLLNTKFSPQERIPLKGTFVHAFREKELGGKHLFLVYFPLSKQKSKAVILHKNKRL